MPLTALQDTVPQKSKDTIPKKPVFNNADTLRKDSLRRINAADTSFIPVTDTFSVKMSKDSLDAPVYYEAEDSAVVLAKDKKVILYGKTKTNYKDIELKAPKTELDQETQILTAVNKVDSTGEILERAHFAQGENKFQSDTIRYNFKTQKGLSKHTFTMMNDMVMISDDAKRIGNVVYSKKGTISTCTLDDPHFGFRYDKIKVVNNKTVITGPIHPEFEGVPIPIYLPFGFFPLNSKRHSGFLPPTFTTNQDFGLGLEGLGYYKTIGEYFDVMTRANIYSYGGWTLNVIPTYQKRYKYKGQLNFGIQNTKYNFKGDPDYTKNKSYSIMWSHSSDNRARPGTSFSANVNAASTTFNRYVPNDANRNFQNQLGSSITYSKTFRTSNLTISANHNQNNELHLINLNLPDVSYSLNTLYPFQGKEVAGTPKWYDKIGIGYNGNLKNQISFYDTAFSFNQLLDTLQWGAQHNFPLTLSLPPILNGALLLTPSVSYESKWINQKFRRSWNSTLEKVDTTITKGFYTDHRVAFGLGMNTTLYGFYNFSGARKTSIRHVMRPSIGFSYSPSLSKSHYYRIQVDTLGRVLPFNEFEGSLFGFYGGQDFGGATFSLDNTLEMRSKSKKDSTFKKVRLLDGFGFSFSYNFIADSFQLTPINFYLRSTLFEKINITAGAILNPYQADSFGVPINKFAWQGEGFSLGRLVNGSLSVSTDFQSKPRDDKKEQERKQREQQLLNDPILGQDMQSQMDYMRRNPADFVDFNIPWRISLGLSVFYTQVLKRDYSGYRNEFSSNLTFNGSFALTPKWNFALNGYYDFVTKNLQTFTMSINRDMHCWQLAIGVTPVGLYRSFFFTISPKSGLLQDLKINRSKYFYQH